MTKLLRFKIYFLVVVFQMARVKQTRYRPSERDLRRAIRYFGGIDSRQVNQDSITASTDIENSSTNDMIHNLNGLYENNKDKADYII